MLGKRYIHVPARLCVNARFMKTVNKSSKGQCSCCKKEFLIIVNTAIVCQSCDGVAEWPEMRFNEKSFDDEGK